MAEMKVGDRTRGNGHPTFIIEDMGVKQNGKIQLASDLFDEAIHAGTDAVKLNKRNLEELYPNKLLKKLYLGEKNQPYILADGESNPGAMPRISEVNLIVMEGQLSD